MQAAIRMQDVTHVYVAKKRAVVALEQISFELMPGEFASLIGPSGCGKTTLLSMIAGLIRPTQGDIRIFGEPVTKPSPRIGYMLQQDYLFPWRTIYDNAVIGLELRGELSPENKDYVLHLLAEMGLDGFKDALPQQLSGGMRQRVALVRTMATKPDILLLDEPFSALDYQTKLQLEDLVAQTIRTHGKTALLVTHDIAEAIAMSDRIVVLQARPGRIRSELEVPSAIRGDMPLTARKRQDFQIMFEKVWTEFEQLAGTAGDGGLAGEEAGSDE